MALDYISNYYCDFNCFDRDKIKVKIRENGKSNNSIASLKKKIEEKIEEN